MRPAGGAHRFAPSRSASWRSWFEDCREPAADGGVVRVDGAELRAPLREVDVEQRRQVLVGEVETSQVEGVGAGTLPIGVARASPRSAQRSKIQASTLEFSPKPGHMKRPSASLRNQLTE